jgi:predicted RNA methylase
MIGILRNKIGNMTWEYRLGISTRGVNGAEIVDDEHIHYGTVPYRTINAVLDRIGPLPGEVFVDLGCGKGRVVCCAALRRFRASIGVECSPSLAAIAGRNAAALRPRHAPIEIRTISAEQFDFTQGSVFYLFHPFGPNTLRAVLLALHKSLESAPRLVRLVYVNPVHADVVREFTWLVEQEHWKAGSGASPDHDIGWWTNSDHLPR